MTQKAAPTNIIYAVKASWVRLCRILDEIRCQTDGPALLTQAQVCDCLGFGIVCGVEMEKQLYDTLYDAGASGEPETGELSAPWKYCHPILCSCGPVGS